MREWVTDGPCGQAEGSHRGSAHLEDLVADLHELLLRDEAFGVERKHVGRLDGLLAVTAEHNAERRTRRRARDRHGEQLALEIAVLALQLCCTKPTSLL